MSADSCLMSIVSFGVCVNLNSELMRVMLCDVGTKRVGGMAVMIKLPTTRW